MFVVVVVLVVDVKGKKGEKGEEMKGQLGLSSRSTDDGWSWMSDVG